MSLFGWVRGTGRRRFNQAAALAEIAGLREALDHWQPRALVAEAELETVTRDRDELEQALEVAAVEYNELDARQTVLRKQLAAASAAEANRKAISVDAPADLGRVKNRAEETTEAINVTTLRARFGAGPVPVMPVGGAA